jgi:hypothetical protein
VLFVSAPPDRLGRGIKAAKKVPAGRIHAHQFIKTCLAAPTTLLKNSGLMP